MAENKENKEFRLILRLIDTDLDGITYGDALLAMDTSDDWFTIYNGVPPLKPQLSGPVYGRPNKSYTYCAFTTDEDEDDIEYEFHWGDGQTTTTVFYPSGETVCVPHAWSLENTYSVTVRAYDGLHWSEYSSPLTVTIDNTHPDIEITKPRNGLYIYDSVMIIPLFRAIVVGPITIKANAYDELSGIKNVTFLINMDLF